jgi:pimeloyl-ACP methyl ester carboxylesterase
VTNLHALPSGGSGHEFVPSHCPQEEYAAFLTNPDLGSEYRRTRLLQGYRRFLDHYPDLTAWQQHSLKERIGWRNTEVQSRRSAPSESFDVATGWINFNARQYLYYLGFTGRLRLDWDWLLGVGVLKPWGIAEALELPLIAQTDALLDRAIELGLVIKNCRQRVHWMIARLVLHRGDPDLSALAIDDIEDLREVLRTVDTIRQIRSVLDDQTLHRAWKTWSAMVFQTGVVLFHGGVIDQLPKRLATKERRTSMTDFSLTPTPIRVPDDVLADLQRRLELTRWPVDAGNDSYYGVNRPYLQELVEYWRDDYDWREAEAAINAYEHYRVEVDGVPVHFMRRPGAGPSPTPLILTHGWPWTFWHWAKVVDPLADPGAYGGDPAEAFDVIVPSFPGFGFSTPLPDRPDMNFWKVADLWHTLMTGILGHERYAAAGCDVGALVTGQLGHKYAAELYAIHIGSGLKLNLFNGDRAWDLSGGRPIPEGLPADIHAQVVAFEKRFAVHLAAHVLDPSTLSYGLSDSPAGMLAGSSNAG